MMNVVYAQPLRLMYFTAPHVKLIELICCDDANDADDACVVDI